MAYGLNLDKLFCRANDGRPFTFSVVIKSILLRFKMPLESSAPAIQQWVNRNSGNSAARI